MSIRMIASVVVAALLMTGGAATAGQVTEYGVHPAQETQTTLTKEEAKTIALNHAGLQESQVKGLRAEYDGDDRVPEWEVEFYADGLEYDYEIHAETGEIRSWDKERDD